MLRPIARLVLRNWDILPNSTLIWARGYLSQGRLVPNLLLTFLTDLFIYFGTIVGLFAFMFVAIALITGIVG